MTTSILAEYTALNAMEVKDLLTEWNKYFDRPPSSHNNKTYLINQIIYRIQELKYGGLTRRTIDRLEALAEDRAITERKHMPSRLAVGTRLVREVKGIEHHVQVLADGYEYQGAKYRSLSGVAYAITGTRWNGNEFFGLGKKTDGEKRPYHRSRQWLAEQAKKAKS